MCPIPGHPPGPLSSLFVVLHYIPRQAYLRNFDDSLDIFHYLLGHTLLDDLNSGLVNLLDDFLHLKTIFSLWQSGFCLRHLQLGLGGKPYLARDPAVGPYLEIFGWILGSGRCPDR